MPGDELGPDRAALIPGPGVVSKHRTKDRTSVHHRALAWQEPLDATASIPLNEPEADYPNVLCVLPRGDDPGTRGRPELIQGIDHRPRAAIEHHRYIRLLGSKAVENWPSRASISRQASATTSASVAYWPLDLLPNKIFEPLWDGDVHRILALDVGLELT